ncbi:MAG: phenylalanine--tRNA ligase subunit beta [Deltaproteobacteria bacterium]|nr:phenylalanine--tRNA ligase subunit beta [Deltaproteobacteria bacterium]MBW2398425.1 phenylalanine--tRNA ligase subunit beta [Deltaproteobacteria bacterium]
MRVSLDWLAEWIELPGDEELSERLNLGGFEDAEIETSGPDLSAVVVGHVKECGPHPNADRLSFCKVDTGSGELVEVVCGAPNVSEGQKIAFASVGSRLPDGTKLKKTKIRGIVSRGMICSARELGLSEEHDGILVLDSEAPVGTPLPEVISVGDRTLEFGITPNRGDVTSLLGVAREVHALIGGEPTPPETEPPETGAPASEAVSVAIAAAEDCHHYAARVVRGVRVGPSPDHVVRRLEAAGIRSINNVVDATNWVLLEFGQPLHAFDLATLHGGRVEVRRAAAGEKLACLDGETRELDPSDLVICDAERPIALAGVMGGADSEVGEKTRDILIESAHFHPTVVRLTARRHGLQTEASYRFERGVDREGVLRAADRVARLIVEWAGGEVASGVVAARGAEPVVTREIDLDVARANRLLGTEIEVAEARALLARVGVECREIGPGVLTGSVPSHRNDLHVHQDLTEEVARVYGYDRIPTTLPTAELHPVAEPTTWQLGERVRDEFVAAGLSEAICLPFVPLGDSDALRLAADDPRRSQRTIVNPLKEEEPLLRTTLAPSLLRLAQQNLSRQIDAVALFEISSVFLPRSSEAGGAEPLAAAAVLSEPQEAALWNRKNPIPLFFRAKGVAERLLIQAGYVALWRGQTESPYLHPGASATIEVGGHVVGTVGEIHPEVAANFALDVPCALIELDLGRLEAQPRRAKEFHEVSRQPAARRDLAVLLGDDLAAGDVLAAIEQAGGADLQSVELFDRYAGKGVPEGRVSLAFRLAFQKMDRALTEKEVSKSVDRIVRMLSHRFGGELR